MMVIIPLPMIHILNEKSDTLSENGFNIYYFDVIYVFIRLRIV